MSNILELDPRLYDLIRQKSIRNIQEALVELITNSYDAYNVVENELTGSEVTNLPIEIESYEEIRTILVRDQARGLTAQEISDRILIVGGLTAEETSRGLMGRGAKDITAIGTARFVSIRNNLISEVILNTDLTYVWVKQDQPLAENDRTTYKIAGNGFIAYLVVDNVVPFISGTELYQRICKNIYLRNIILEGKHPIKSDGTLVTYSHPPNSKKIIETTFDVEGYPGATASLVIYSVLDAISNPKYPDELEYGVLVCSSKAVYECSGLYAEDELFARDYRWNPNLKYIYGELKCDHIDVLARDVTENKTESNPFLIIDPARRNGLSKKHPFTKALYEIPYKWLDVVLNRMQDIHEDSLLADDYLDGFLNNVSNFIHNNLDLETVLYTWRSKDDQENLNSIVGRVNTLNIDNDTLNINQEIIDNIIEGEIINPLPIQQVSDSHPNIEIKISDDQAMTKPYDVIYFSDRIIIKINANDQSLKPYAEISTNIVEGVEKSTITIDSEAAMVSLNDTLRDAIVHMLTRQTIMGTQVETNSNTDNYNEIISIQDGIRNNISAKTKKLYDTVYTKYH